MKYLVNMIDNLGNGFEDKEFYSIYDKKEFRKWLRKELKQQGYGKIMLLEIKEELFV